jgi:transcriptional regulator with GAF, ATPase, and Fis domain
MARTLYTWIGKTDIDAMSGTRGPGPIARALEDRELDLRLMRIVVLDDTQDGQGARYADWLRARHPNIRVVRENTGETSDPTDFQWIYDMSRRAVAMHGNGNQDADGRFYLLSAGTSTMSACWMLLSVMERTRAELVQTSQHRGARIVQLPVDVLLQDAPSPGRANRQRIDALSGQGAPGLIAECVAMREVLRLVDIAANSDLPVLILGETGTGKEVIAKRLHERSSRSKEPFLAINCGAIPGELLESELFGHSKGAFTGADADRKGMLEEAGTGTVFLDEIGELPAKQQAKLLRVLQERKIKPIGKPGEIHIQCRFVAATHRDPMLEVAAGTMREDLFYRIANIVLSLPPLRERGKDLDHLIDSVWANIVQGNPGFPGKELSSGARARLHSHGWPGNIRELKATLARASFVAESVILQEADIDRAIIARPSRKMDMAGGEVPVLGDGFDFDLYLDSVTKGLVERALDESGGAKAAAARLLGFGTEKRMRVQRLMKKHGIP